jgi:6-phospho-beta-glucosidase
MKIVIIGGSSHTTPALVQLFTASCPDPSIAEIVLVSRSLERLRAIARACRIISTNPNIKISYSSVFEPNWRDMVADANVILLQPRIGGYPGRLFDETFPLKYGIPGDQVLGPGGLASAWRSWPTLRNYLHVASQMAPSALILFLTTPFGILLRLGQEVIPSQTLLGICELPETSLRLICRDLNVPRESVTFEYFGINHFGWFYLLKHAGQDLVHRYADLLMSRGDSAYSRAINLYSAIPTPYVRLHYSLQKCVANQKKQDLPRAVLLSKHDRHSLKILSTGDERSIRSVLEKRPTPWYKYSVVPFLASLSRGLPFSPVFLSTPFKGDLSVFRKTDIMEIPFCVSSGGMNPFRQSTYPSKKLTALVQSYVEHERIAAEAVRDRSVDLLIDALLVHPWVKNAAIARRLAEEIRSTTSYA